MSTPYFRHLTMYEQAQKKERKKERKKKLMVKNQE